LWKVQRKELEIKQITIMKNVLKTTMTLGLAGMLGLANAALAQDGPTYSVLPLKKSSRVLFSLPKNNAAKVKLNIKDSEGQLLHTETMKGGQDLAKVYDLSKVKPGKYVFEVVADGQAATTREVVPQGMPEAGLVMRVSAAGGQGYAHLSYFNNFDNATVGIRVLNAAGEEVHNSYSTSEDYYKFFNFSKMAAGKYTFVLTSGSQEVKQVFELVK
jgi:hypothetical protein